MENIGEANIGVTMALQIVVRALIKTHPNAAALLTSIGEEEEPMQALLLARNTPEEALSAMNLALQTFRSKLRSHT